MLENDRLEKSTWRTHRYFVDFESQIHIEISTSNRCHDFHVDSPFSKSMKSRRTFHLEFQRQIDGESKKCVYWVNVSLGLNHNK